MGWSGVRWERGGESKTSVSESERGARGQGHEGHTLRVLSRRPVHEQHVERETAHEKSLTKKCHAQQVEKKRKSISQRWATEHRDKDIAGRSITRDEHVQKNKKGTANCRHKSKPNSEKVKGVPNSMG